MTKQEKKKAFTKESSHAVGKSRQLCAFERLRETDKREESVAAGRTTRA